MKRAIIILAGALWASLALGACDDIHISKQIRIGEEEPFEATGTGRSVSSVEAAKLQEAASVMSVDAWPAQGVKVFTVAGGDPAVNGLHAYFAAYVDPSQGWRIFEIGDFTDFKVVNFQPGRVSIDATEWAPDTGAVADEKGLVEIKPQHRRMLVTYEPLGEGSPA